MSKENHRLSKECLKEEIEMEVEWCASCDTFELWYVFRISMVLQQCLLTLEQVYVFFIIHLDKWKEMKVPSWFAFARRKYR